VRHLLAHIEAPALVLHRRDDQWVDPANGRYLAEHLPHARYRELDGADHWPWFGDADSVLQPVEEFLATLRQAPEGFPRVASPR
jgi:pimeloyl-ACP methyl ester carboxylesterase